MRRVSTESVFPGQKLAKTVFSSDGKILLEKGIELTVQHISRLKYFDIKELYIEDLISFGIDCGETIREETREESKELVRKIMVSNAASLDAEYKEIEKLINDIIDQLLDRSDILINLSEIRVVDNYTYEHSVSVCVYALIMGISLGYSEQEMLELGIGAILHDIGKLKIPDSILKKPAKLTDEEFELIKKHTTYGYEILSSSENISIKSAEVALYHHERIDGSGYPTKINKDEIPEYAKITAVADVFDALTSDRVYRSKLGIKEVVEYMTTSGRNFFDSDILTLFMRHITIYPAGTTVVLSNGEKAIVLDVNREFPSKPIVRVVKDSSDKPLENFIEKDLSVEKELSIAGTCDL